MPIMLGHHTNFNTLFAEGARREDIRIYADITEEYERDMQNGALPTGRKPKFDSLSEAVMRGEFNPIKEKVSRLYKGGARMTVTDIGLRLRIVYENDEKYRFCLIYNGSEESAISLEPETCLVNCPNSPFSREEAGFDFLAPDEEKIYRSKITLEKF